MRRKRRKKIRMKEFRFYFEFWAALEQKICVKDVVLILLYNFHIYLLLEVLIIFTIKPKTKTPTQKNQ